MLRCYGYGGMILFDYQYIILKIGVTTYIVVFEIGAFIVICPFTILRPFRHQKHTVYPASLTDGITRRFLSFSGRFYRWMLRT